MDITLISLLFDAGLFVLIWMVQLVVYPSFLYFEKENLLKWHQQYTKGLSVIVIPLMFGQLITAIIQLVQFSSLETIIRFIMVSAVWISTFAQFVPIHTKITNHKATEKLLKQLVLKNWLRTLLWTLILGWSLYMST
tara:strand:- start:3035 stop:3445 length:411 start_codon:yes stop_codon:yes gene_type:complete